MEFPHVNDLGSPAMLKLMSSTAGPCLQRLSSVTGISSYLKAMFMILGIQRSAFPLPPPSQCSDGVYNNWMTTS